MLGRISTHFASAALAAFQLSCSAAAEPAAAPIADGATGPAMGHAPASIEFEVVTLAGDRLTARDLRGRLTVIALITTYDQASQAEALFVAGLARGHTPRLNALGLVLEPPENRPLVDAYAASLRLPYPLAFADAPTIAGRGTFAGLHHVPSVVVLDRDGREAYRHIGLIEGDALEAAVRQVEAASPPHE